ncbi:hypothetical protein RF11_01394 [Thelohanellus kitauei]|uniref:Uncharacterized protein n=1 Tax=Thelohanellus kitauei TaxID=669202 RepID=A0A0C2J1U7_THEKT|nr:hypothetical protein RF11_01394 [Thelohanellus kitauei]
MLCTYTQTSTSESFIFLRKTPMIKESTINFNLQGYYLGADQLFCLNTRDEDQKHVGQKRLVYKSPHYAKSTLFWETKLNHPPLVAVEILLSPSLINCINHFHIILEQRFFDVSHELCALLRLFDPREILW